jgi:hypothetical protein
VSLVATASEGSTRRPLPNAVLLPAIAVLAFLVRLLPVLHGGGLESYGRYDDGVYYAAADALTFGRVPYRSFVLLHPPGILLVVAPFALLGRLTSDPVGMAVARLAFMGVGALNAVLVCALARRWNLRAAVAAGVLYACWMPAVYNEQSTLLEPLGGTALLVALLLLLQEKPTVRAEILAGVALGLAEALKIWYVAPWAVVVVWLLFVRRPKSALRVALSGGVALLIVLLPFLILGRRLMYEMVVRDQLLRVPGSASRLARFSSILGTHFPLIGHATSQHVATVVVLIVLTIAAICCLFDGRARLIALLLFGNMVVLLASPSYFGHYAALTAAPGALVLGIGLGKLPLTAKLWRPSIAVFAVALIAFLASGVRIAMLKEGKTFPRKEFAAAAPAGCVASDDPTALIEMNRLSRDLAAGCRVEIDVSGAIYQRFRETKDGVDVSRTDNVGFQSYLSRYLRSGSSFVIARQIGDQMPPQRLRQIRRQPAIVQADDLTLRRGDGPLP